MVVYLAPDAFDHLYRKVGCTAADVATLRKAIYGRVVSIPLGIHTLEEILLDDQAVARVRSARMRMLLSVSSPRTLLKPAEELLLDDVRSFAASGVPVSPILRGEPQNAVSAGISALLESDGEEMDEDFVETLEAARRQRESLGAALREMEDGDSPLSAPASVSGGFDQYFRERAVAVAEALAERAGVAPQCRARGIEALLGVKSARMWTGAALALAWAQAVEGRARSAEDLGDAIHALTAAAAADTFVSDDERLRTLSSRAQVPGFAVIDLKTLLAQAS